MSDAPHLCSGAIAVDVLLYVCGLCSGCCTIIFRVENFFDDDPAPGQNPDQSLLSKEIHDDSVNNDTLMQI